MRISQGDPRMLPAATETRQMWDRLATYYPERAQWAGNIQVLADAPVDATASLRQSISALPGVTGVDTRRIGPRLTLRRGRPARPRRGLGRAGPSRRSGAAGRVPRTGHR